MASLIVQDCAMGPLGYLWTEASIEFVELYGLIVDFETGNVFQNPDEKKEVQSVQWSFDNCLTLHMVDGSCRVLLPGAVVGYSPVSPSVPKLTKLAEHVNGLT